MSIDEILSYSSTIRPMQSILYQYIFTRRMGRNSMVKCSTSWDFYCSTFCHGHKHMDSPNLVLLPSERRGMIIWMIMMWILSLSSLVFVLFRFLPWLYSYGHSFNGEIGLVGRYDAAEMLRISISIVWAMILILAAMSVVTIAGASKLLWSGNSGWWRLRIHGIMLDVVVAGNSNKPTRFALFTNNISIRTWLN